MSAIKVVDRPLAYPGRTIYGKTNGPVAYLGQVIEGVHVFLNESESREVLHAWGWAPNEQYLELKAALLAAEGRIAELEEQLAEAQAQVVKVVPMDDVILALK